MNVLIESSSRIGSRVYVMASCEGVDAFVSVADSGEVQVCCQNAAHRVFRGAGRSFPTAAEALDAYKSCEMRAIIRAAVDAAGCNRATEQATEQRLLAAS